MDAAKPGFVAAAAEARRTWGGRYGRAWLALAVLSVIAAAVVVWLTPGAPRGPLGTGFGWTGNAGFREAFWTLCALACWVPAWLGADLFNSAGPRGQDRPGARLLGRVLPFGLVLFLAAAVLTGGYHLRQLAGDPIEFWYGPLYEPILGEPAPLTGAAAATWIGWALIIPLSGLPYALGAALLSALSRRRRRWVVAPFTVLVGSAALGVALSWHAHSIWEFPPFDVYVSGEMLLRRWDRAVLVPNFCVGVLGAAFIEKRFGSPPESDFGYLLYCANAALIFLGLSAIQALWLVSIQRRRAR
ncbi:MAG: hypothetical protein ACK47B_11295 [Armatimonadota bacterium]